MHGAPGESPSSCSLLNATPAFALALSRPHAGSVNTASYAAWYTENVRTLPSGKRIRAVTEEAAAQARGFAWSKDGRGRFFVTEAERQRAGLVSMMPPGARRS